MKKYVIGFLLFLMNGQAQQLTHLTYDVSSKIGLTSNALNDLLIDQQQFLWIASDKGLFKFDEKYFIRIDGFAANKNIIKLNYQNNKLYCLTGDYKIYEIVKSQANLLSIDIANKKTKALLQPQEFFVFNDNHFYFIKDEILEVKSNKSQLLAGLIYGPDILYTKQNNSWTAIKSVPLDLNELTEIPWFNESNQAVHCIKSNDSYYFYKKSKSNIVYSLKNGQFKRHEIPYFIESLSVDAKGFIWISMVNNTLVKYDDNFRFFDFVKSKIKGKVDVDESGNIWFATNNRGLLKFPNTAVKAFIINEAENLKNLYFVENKAYFETNDDLKQSLNLGSNTINEKETGVYDLAELLKLLYFNENKKEFPNGVKLYLNNELLNIKSIQRYEINKFLITTNYKIYFFDLIAKELKEVYKSSLSINDAFFDGKNNIIVALNNQTINYEILSKKVKIIFKETQVNTIKKHENNFLFASENKGIFVTDYNFKVLSSKLTFVDEDLAVLPIKGIELVKDKIFVYSSKGIYLYEFNDELKLKNHFNETNGLPDNDVEHFQIFNNRLYGITKSHFFIFDLLNENLKSDLKLDIPTIEKLSFGQQDFFDFDNIDVDFRAGALQLKICSPYLSNSNRLNFKYKLVGFDTDWQTSKDGLIEYFEYPAGNQTIEFYSIVDNGQSVSEVGALAFYVSQPLWFRNWFKWVFVIFLFGLVLGLIGFFYFTKFKDLQHEKKVVEYQQKALRAQINPHFLFNALNSIQNFALKNDVVQLSNYIEKFASLTRSILNHSENEFITLENEIKVLENYMDIEKLRFQNFDYEVLTDSNIDTTFIFVPSLLLQPLVENAIWHGFQNSPRFGHLKLQFNLDNSSLKISVEDNGVGRVFKPNKTHKSKGMELIKTRLNLLNHSQTALQVIDKVEDGVNNGTIVDLTLPILTIKNLDKPKRTFYNVIYQVIKSFFNKFIK